jgi:hypothetical protein
LSFWSFLRALFQFSKRAAGEATKFGRGGIELLSVISAARFECGEPAAEAGELIRWQLGNSFGDLFDFHAAQYSIALFVQGLREAARQIARHRRRGDRVTNRAFIGTLHMLRCTEVSSRSDVKGQLLPIHPASVPNNVRFAPKATIIHPGTD